MIATLLRLAGINANVKYEICSWQSGQKNTSWIAPGGGVSIYIYNYIYIFFFHSHNLCLFVCIDTVYIYIHMQAVTYISLEYFI